GERQQPAASPGAAGEEPSLPVSDAAPLTDAVAMRALAHPVRVSLIELLAVVDTLTATQASEVLGESPANCAFHLRTLGKYGFVEEAGGGRGRERASRRGHAVIRVTSPDGSREHAAAATALSDLVLSALVDRARETLTRRDAWPAGWQQDTLSQ